jgi:hypothetical protein
MNGSGKRCWPLLKGLGPLSAKEICAGPTLDADQRLDWLDAADWQALTDAFRTFWQTVADEQYQPPLSSILKKTKRWPTHLIRCTQYPKEWQPATQL